MCPFTNVLLLTVILILFPFKANDLLMVISKVHVRVSPALTSCPHKQVEGAFAHRWGQARPGSCQTRLGDIAALFVFADSRPGKTLTVSSPSPPACAPKPDSFPSMLAGSESSVLFVAQMQSPLQVQAGSAPRRDG